MPQIDAGRVLSDLRRLAEFGRYETGNHRPTYSPIDMESRHWFADRLRAAGLDATIDGIGNVIGRDPRARSRLLVGSHLETQPRGGWLDGALGPGAGQHLADRGGRLGAALAHVEMGVGAIGDKGID